MSFTWEAPTNSFYKNLVCVAHKGQKYGNKPYTTHLRDVQQRWSSLFEPDYDDNLSKEETEAVIKYTDEANFACLGHDLLEDCPDVTVDTLREAGVPEASIKAIVLCTKTKEVSYKQYLRSIAEDKLAFEVKVADTYANMTQSMKDGNFKRVKKYSEQINILYSYREEVLRAYSCMGLR